MNAPLTEEEARAQAAGTRRPLLVWLIVVWYLFGAIITLGFMILDQRGFIPKDITGAEYSKLENLASDVRSIVESVLVICGCVFLFIMRKAAYPMFLASLIIAIVFLGYEVVVRNFVATATQTVVFSTFFGFVINIAVLAYIGKLRDQGVLK